MNTAARNQVVGLVLIVLGALFLLGHLDFGNFAWPLFILIPGLLLLGGMTFASAAGLAIPGSIVTTVGLILFVQNLTGRFESWAYAWALIPTAVGIGQFVQGSRTDSERLRRRGSRTASVGLVLFILFGAFFELFIFNDVAGGFFGRFLAPALLIGGGVYLLVRQDPSPESDA